MDRLEVLLRTGNLVGLWDRLRMWHNHSEDSRNGNRYEKAAKAFSETVEATLWNGLDADLGVLSCPLQSLPHTHLTVVDVGVRVGRSPITLRLCRIASVSQVRSPSQRGTGGVLVTDGGDDDDDNDDSS